MLYVLNVKTAETPFVSTLPDGQEVLRFGFRIIRLWEMSVDDLRRSGRLGLYPLLPLARDGRRPEVVEAVITDLIAGANYDLLAFAYLFSALTFSDKGDLAWLRRRFAVFHDILEGSWAYQEILERGLQKGLQQGQQEALQRGQQNGLIQALLAIVEARFPALLPQARALVEQVHDPLTLQRLIVMLTLAQSAEEADHTLNNDAGAS